MALKIFCSNPVGLRVKIKRYIDEGKVTTWSYNSKNEFDHTPSQWSGTAKLFLEANDSAGYLLCYVQHPDGFKAFRNSAAYGVYQGRFVEMLMNHFPGDFHFIASGTYDNVKDLTYSPSATT